MLVLQNGAFVCIQEVGNRIDWLNNSDPEKSDIELWKSCKYYIPHVLLYTDLLVLM